MDIIRLLPEHLANQIAAGEVVQRPASVVKELLENAVDAGGTTLRLLVRDAGRTLIQVIDDGCGMSETDARLSLERHATSKIRQTEDLFTIRTFGFRGEALASIAAVARVELKTCLTDADTGTRLVIENSRVVSQEPCAAPAGTSITVRDLFYNVPARRAFLKSNAVEMRHILDEFQRVALANPQLAFSLHQNELEVFNLPPANLAQRIVGLLGAGYKSHLAACDEDTPSVQVTGYVGKPEGARRARGDQFFFVNGRFIRSAYLNHAVLTAYEGLLAKDAHPFYVLFLAIDPREIDINVHPTKTEIKFADEKTVYAIVCAAVRRALGLYNLAPTLDFEGDVNFAPFRQVMGGSGGEMSGAGVMPPPASPGASVNRAHGKAGPERVRRETSAASGPSSAFGPAAVPAEPMAWPTSSFDTPVGVTAAAAFPSAEVPVVASDPLAPAAPAATFFGSQPSAPAASGLDSLSPKPLQLHQRYVVVAVRSGLMMIDQQAARERILYEDYGRGAADAPRPAQTLLFPQALQFPAADFALIEELLPELEHLGFRLRTLGPRALVAEAVPADVPAADVQILLDGVLEQVRAGRSTTDVRLAAREQVARAVARRAAARYTQKLSTAEMSALVDRLFACQTPTATPSGQRTLVVMAEGQIEALFAAELNDQ